jgi:hypothetical protein
MRPMFTRIVLAGVLAAGAILLAGTAPALASTSGAAAVSDCNAHGRLTAHYSPQQLQNALSTMPADVKEYTDCYDVIQRQLLAEVGKPSGSNSADGSGSGGSFLATPVIVVIVILALAAATFGGIALRRRGGGGEGS